jgi:uncharacterized protein (UPF0179 family)
MVTIEEKKIEVGAKIFFLRCRVEASDCGCEECNEDTACDGKLIALDTLEGLFELVMTTSPVWTMNRLADIERAIEELTRRLFLDD